MTNNDEITNNDTNLDLGYRKEVKETLGFVEFPKECIT